MPVPIAYSFRNLRTRSLTTTLTAGGMALVVFVFTATLMLVEGLRQTLVSTGLAANALVIRKGSGTEVQSGLERNQALTIAGRPEIATGDRGQILAARECVVLIALRKRSTGKLSNVVIRGIGEASLALRPQVRVVVGRAPRPGSNEIMVGQSVADGFLNAGLGDRLRFGKREWDIVGIFDAGKTGFSSEIWGDSTQLMPAFGRNAYSLVLARMIDARAYEAFKRDVEADPRLQAEVWTETGYYEKQSEMMAKFLGILGISLTTVFSLGAMIGAMITMYSAVATRVSEIGTLRALGFGRASILVAFLAESLLLGLSGGLAGVGLAWLLRFVSFSTTNFQTFAELSFSFALTPGITLASLGFALSMGVVGGFLPAVRAARLNIVEALRAA